MARVVRILNDLARDFSLMAQRLGSILTHEDRIKKLSHYIYIYIYEFLNFEFQNSEF